MAKPYLKGVNAGIQFAITVIGKFDDSVKTVRFLTELLISLKNIDMKTNIDIREYLTLRLQALDKE